MVLVIIFSFGIQWYTLNYLPVFDCLPYKKENNIPEQMRMPANAVPDSTVITFVYKKNGKEVEFTADQFPEDFNTPPYEFVKRYDKVIRKGKNNIPPVKGFVLTGSTNQDSAQFVLSQPYAILLFCENFSVPVSAWQKDFEKLYAAAKAKNIPAFVITTQFEESQQRLAANSFKDIAIFKCDFTAIRTAARVNPTIYLLKEGTITDKKSYKRMDDIMKQLESIPIQKPAPLPVEEIPLQPDTSNQPTSQP
jgi:hypothetical protein